MLCNILCPRLQCVDIRFTSFGNTQRSQCRKSFAHDGNVGANICGPFIKVINKFNYSIIRGQFPDIHQTLNAFFCLDKIIMHTLRAACVFSQGPIKNIIENGLQRGQGIGELWAFP